MYANVVDRIYRCDNVLIKYMNQVNLCDKDFKILDRYRGYLDILKDVGPTHLERHYLLNMMFKEGELEVFKDDDNYIVNSLRKDVIEFYLKDKPAIQVTVETLNKFK